MQLIAKTMSPEAASKMYAMWLRSTAAVAVQPVTPRLFFRMIAYSTMSLFGLKHSAFSTEPVVWCLRKAEVLGLRLNPWTAMFIAQHCQSFDRMHVFLHMLRLRLVGISHPNGPALIMVAFPQGLPSEAVLQDLWDRQAPANPALPPLLHWVSAA